MRRRTSLVLAMLGSLGVAGACAEARSTTPAEPHEDPPTLGASTTVAPVAPAEPEHTCDVLATALDAGVHDAEPPPDAGARPGVPVIVFHGVCDGPCTPDRLYDMSRDELDVLFGGIATRGFTTLTIADYVAWFHGEKELDERRSVLLTFDDGRREAYLLADPVLAAHGLRATMFVITQTADADLAAHMTWGHVEAAARSGRWDLQLHGGRGHSRITTTGPDGGTVAGPFYAWRARDGGALEPLDGWRARVEDDLATGVARLEAHVPGFRPLAFAVPYGDYGQKGTNDPSIPILFRDVLESRFGVWFTQADRLDEAPRPRGTPNREGKRFAIHVGTRAADVLGWLDRGGPR